MNHHTAITTGADIRAAEDALFAEWKSVSPKMVTDGAADADHYVASDVKILLLLKEVNDPDGGGWDLREFVRNGGRSHTWNNIARWVRGIRAMPQDLSWGELEPVSADDRRELLASIVAMNLKKEPGGHTSVGSQIAGAATTASELLRRQFAIYNPDLVICCKTAGLVHNVLPAGEALHWEKTTRGIRHARLPSGRPIVDFSHPMARCPDSLLAYGLLDAVREICHGRPG